MNDDAARGDTEFIFSNWDSTITCYPDNYFQPRTEAEIVEIVKDAYKRGGGVRTFGAGHSWSPLVPTNDTLINLDKLDKAVAIDKGRMRASVQAGIRIKNLVKLLRSNGLGMRNLGSIKEQSIAGAVSTATHGTGRDIGNISTQIVGMNLVTGRGDMLTISEERDPELMSAARTSLGALGIISRVTLQCVRDYNLLYKSEHHPFEEVLDQLNHYLDNNERVRLYWLTLSPDNIRVMTMNPTSAATIDTKEVVDGLTGDVIKKGVIQPVSANTYHLHYWQGLGLKVRFNKRRQSEARVTWIDEEKVKPYDDALTVSMPPRHQESEYAIPIGRAAEAVRALRRLIEEKGYTDTILVEVRFVGQDDIMLSPSHEGPVCYVGGYIFGIFDEVNAKDFFENYESLMKGFQGRPHWGKHLTLSPQEARQMYTRFDRFNEIRKELDPNGVFANDFIRNLFG